MSCDPFESVVPGLIGECDPIDFGCLPVTDGVPADDPLQDQLPFAYDPTTGCLWYFVCVDGWTSFCPPDEPDPVDFGCIPITNGDPGADPLGTELPFAYDPDTGCIWQFICDNGWTSFCPVEPCDCIEPVVIEGTSGILVNNRCYTMGFGDRLKDTKDGDFEGAPPGEGIPIEFTFTNPTNMTGVLTVDAKMWANRTVPGDGSSEAGLRASVVFMLGEITSIDGYPFDPTETVPGGQAQTPHNDGDVSYDMRELTLEETYGFWGKWREGLCAFDVECPSGREVACDIDHKFVLAAGASVTVKARIGVGYERSLEVGEVETGWVGANVRYVFEGHNQII